MTPQAFGGERPDPDQHERPDAARYLAEVEPFVAQGSARAFQRDLFFYWSTIHAHPANLTKENRLYRRDIRRVNAALLQPEPMDGIDGATWAFAGPSPPEYAAAQDPPTDEPDFPRLLFLRLLMIDLGLLVRRKQLIHAPDRPEFFQLEATERIRATYTHWKEGAFWNEMLSIPSISIRGCEPRTEPAPEQIAAGRQRVLFHMARLHQDVAADRPSGAGMPWISLAQIVDRVRESDYEFLFPRRLRTDQEVEQIDAYRPYLSDRSPYISYGNRLGWSFSPPFENQAEGWDVVEAGFIRAILVEPLYWMGLIDVGYLDGAAVAYRLTPVGAWVMGVGPEVTFPDQEGRIIVQPNFEIFALDPISDQALAELDAFAQRASGERAIKYQLSRESVYRAQKRGWSVRRILTTLARLTQSQEAPQNELPQNVVRTLQDWQELHERITIHRRANLLHAADPELLQRLRKEPAIAERLLPRDQDDPSPAALIVPGIGPAQDLIQTLEAAGYPPAHTQYVTTADPQLSAIRCLRIARDGQILFEYPLPSLRVLQRLAPFTDRDPEGGRITLTETAVQRALGEGMTVVSILDQLRTLYYGPLPHWIEIQVRAWGRYYGQAAVQNVTLVQVRDPATLQELRQDPEMQALLEPFSPNAQRALALVSAENVDLLLYALAERGMDVHEPLDGLADSELDRAQG